MGCSYDKYKKNGTQGDIVGMDHEVGLRIYIDFARHLHQERSGKH